MFVGKKSRGPIFLFWLRPIGDKGEEPTKSVKCFWLLSLPWKCVAEGSEVSLPQGGLITQSLLTYKIYPSIAMSELTGFEPCVMMFLF